MALTIGSEDAENGMSLAVYTEMDRLLSPPLQAMVDEADGEARVKAQEALDGAREGWKKLAFAIASGVITHLLENMEISGVTTQGDVTVAVQGNTGRATNVEFVQNNDGTGLIR